MKPEDFVVRIDQSETKDDLHPIVEQFANHVGMDGAYVISFDPAAGMTVLDRRPAEWMHRYRKHGYFDFDPIAHRALRDNISFTWEECMGSSRLSTDQKMLLSEARDFGLNQGYNVVEHPRDYAAATVCFYNRDMSDFYESMKAHQDHMVIVGKAAQKKLFDLVTREIPEPKLSARQSQCLTWAAQGKTNSEIGTILEISENTVGAHIKEACRTLGTRTKIHAVSKAIQLKLIFPIDLTI